MNDTQMTLMEAMAAEISRLRIALRFYANGEHFHTHEDEDFDTVSGEPQNWLHSGQEDSTTMIEDGSIAKQALLGVDVTWIDGEEDGTPQPIAGEVSCVGAAAPVSEQPSDFKSKVIEALGFSNNGLNQGRHVTFADEFLLGLIADMVKAGEELSEQDGKDARDAIWRMAARQLPQDALCRSCSTTTTEGAAGGKSSLREPE